MKSFIAIPLMLALALAAPLMAAAQDVTFPSTDGVMEAGPGQPEEDQAQGQQGGSAQKTSRWSQSTSNAVIQYDSESGQIVVIADDETNQYIKQVIENLDQPIPQVMIKVLFLEVTHTKDLDLGFQGSYKGVNGTRTQNILSDFGLSSQTNGGIYQLTDTNVEAFVRAMAETDKLEVLSRPSIMARNNQEASITVGQTIPYITNSRVTDSGQTINTVSYMDVGIILTVTPHITPDRMVEMDVSPEISKLTSQTVPISDTANAFVIDTRSAVTRVVVQDGMTAVIGGMMEDSKTENIKKIPLLGDIPLLGALFRRTVSEKVKTELMIFLTPYVVEHPSEVRAVSLDEKNRLTTLHDSFDKNQLKKFIDNLDDAPKAAPAATTRPESFTVKMPGRKQDAGAQK